MVHQQPQKSPPAQRPVQVTFEAESPVDTAGVILSTPLVIILFIAFVGLIVSMAGSKTEMGQAGQVIGSSGGCEAQISKEVWSQLSTADRLLTGMGCIAATTP